MKQNAIFLCSVFVLALSRRGWGQTDGRLIVDIIEVLSQNTSVRSVRCFGTVITGRHILSTAECAMTGSDSYLSYIVREIGDSESK